MDFACRLAEVNDEDDHPAAEGFYSLGRSEPVVAVTLNLWELRREAQRLRHVGLPLLSE